MSLSKHDVDFACAFFNLLFNEKYKDKHLSIEEFWDLYDKEFDDLYKLCEKATLKNHSEDELKILKNSVRNSCFDGRGFVSDKAVILEKKGFKPWLTEVKPSINWQNWNRYKVYLKSRGRSEDSIQNLDDLTDLLLDHMGNPKSEANWHIRGLLMGDIQSGKTEKYTATCHKAVDAGYRMIVILTGVTNTLRNQTQVRINADLMGMAVSNNVNCAAGVGTVTNTKVTTIFRELTTVDHDFDASKLDQYLNLNIPNSVGVAVCKKNVSVLKNFQKWLSNSKEETTKHLPFLLIDDEADTASVNTRKADDPTAVNKCIREILNYFSKSTYLAVTATPFANIFIDPQVDDEKKSELPDLFPNDFMYAYDPPPEYVGVEKLFGSDRPPEDQSLSHRWIIPLAPSQDKAIDRIHSGKLKKGDVISELPETLKTAVRYFICCCVYRDKFQNPFDHASMLVHVDRHINLQDQLYRLIDKFLKAEYNGVYLYEKQLKTDARYEAYRTLWEDGCFAADYPNSGKTFKELSGKSWKEIWSDDFSAVIKNIQTVAVNSGKEAEKQEEDLISLYKTEGQKHGARVICVGGNSLSRGLTLKGLCVTYFSRISKSYDTLLQMGRWFGYYPNRDVQQYIRIWMSKSSIKFFHYIATALGEFKQLVYRMKDNGKTPADFGLRIRMAPAQTRLAVTYKKGNSAIVSHVVDFAGSLFQTIKFQLKKELRQANVAKIEEFLKKISNYRITEKNSKDFVWQGVPSSEIADFLSDFGVYGWSQGFVADDLGDYIRTNLDVEKWEVRLVSPEEGVERQKAKVGGLLVNKSLRKLVKMPSCYRIPNDQLPSGSDFTRGLSPEQIDEIRRKKAKIVNSSVFADDASGIKNKHSVKKITVYNGDVLSFGPAQPKLFIYVLEIGKIEDWENGETKELSFDETLSESDPDAITRKEDIYGLVVGIPGDPDINRSTKRVKYRVNRIDQLQREDELKEVQGDDRQ